ncbi:AMP-binding protein [Candidatus Poribacteria bacterium]|nr:AMP-binding protein [Candidatus Poribacteria bacterium]
MTKELKLEQLTERGLEEPVAVDMLRCINQLLSSLSASECWRKISQEVLTPHHPFQLHQFLYEIVFSAWDTQQGPPPAWFPSDELMQNANIAKLMRELKLNSYEELQAWSVQNCADFWNLMIQKLGIRFKQAFTNIVHLSCGVEYPQWLVDAKLNIVDSCFSPPCGPPINRGTEEAPAIVFQPEGGAISTITYRELNSLTNRAANGLMDAGFNPGDAIAIDMPMTAESVAIYLGIIKTGCVVVSIADSFAPDEIKVRLRLANAKAIFTQDYIRRAGKQLPLYAKVVSAEAPKAIVLPAFLPPVDWGEGGVALQLRDGDLPWEHFLSDNEEFNSVSCNPDDYTNILFSSGTTGEPKVIPWTQTTSIKCAADGYLHHDIQPGDVVAWPTNLGWMMGPWLIYASLINRATIALYYGAPTGREFGQFVQDARVNILGVVPSLVRTWKNTECMKGLDWRAIKAFSSTGECSNSEDMLFLMSLAGYRPIIEYCGGTEIGGAYITGTVVQPAAPATFTTPALGLDFIILDEDGNHTDNGEVFLIPPSIGLSTELLNQDHHNVYFEGTPKVEKAEGGSQQLPLTTHHSPLTLRRHGDQVERLGGGYYRIHGRVDDTMNLGGIKVSSAEIERTLSLVSGIRETAAIAVSPPEGGPSRLVIYAVLLQGVNVEKEALKTTLQVAIKEHLNPLFRIHDVVIVDSLPRTASNKVMRRVLREKYRTAFWEKRSYVTRRKIL